MQRVQVFRCIICGDPYIGFEKPSNCPFCGAHDQYMVHNSEWRDTNKFDLTEVSRKNFQASLELEMSNTEFYLCVSKTSSKEEIKAMFKALSKIESEHASTICKILRVEKPKVEFKQDLCEGMSEEDILKEADRRENRAVRLYTEFLKQATEDRAKEFFTALIEIESDHIDLINKESSQTSDLKSNVTENPPKNDVVDKLDKEELDYYDSYRRHGD